MTWWALRQFFLWALLLLLAANVAFLSMIVSELICDVDIARFVSVQLGLFTAIYIGVYIIRDQRAANSGDDAESAPVGLTHEIATPLFLANLTTAACLVVLTISQHAPLTRCGLCAALSSLIAASVMLFTLARVTPTLSRLSKRGDSDSVRSSRTIHDRSPAIESSQSKREGVMLSWHSFADWITAAGTIVLPAVLASYTAAAIYLSRWEPEAPVPSNTWVAPIDSLSGDYEGQPLQVFANEAVRRDFWRLQRRLVARRHLLVLAAVVCCAWAIMVGLSRSMVVGSAAELASLLAVVAALTAVAQSQASISGATIAAICLPWCFTLYGRLPFLAYYAQARLHETGSRSAARSALVRFGPTMVYAGLAGAIGLIVLALSPYSPREPVLLLAGGTYGFALLSDLFVLPAVLAAPLPVAIRRRRDRTSVAGVAPSVLSSSTDQRRRKPLDEEPAPRPKQRVWTETALGEDLVACVENERVSPHLRYRLFQDIGCELLTTNYSRGNVGKAVTEARRVGSHLVRLISRDNLVLQDVFRIMRHDAGTYTHVMNVSTYCVMLARQLGINEPIELEEIAVGALLHDLGKLYVPQEIIKKPGKLTPEEWKIMQLHPENGLADLRRHRDLNRGQLMMAYSHHERLDGSGYPKAIGSAEIHDWARLCAVADVFEALTGQRRYRDALGIKEATDFLSDHSGKLLDPDVVACMIQCCSRLC